MRTARHPTIEGMLLLAVSLSACATLDESLSAPDVSLRDVRVQKLELSGQKFVLRFDVSNPNPFPLPVNMIDYGGELDGHRFASGEADCDILVPAGSDSEIAISVEVNLLKTSPELLFIVREAVERDIPYTLVGKMALNIPATGPVRFEHSGRIRLQAGTH